MSHVASMGDRLLVAERVRLLRASCRRRRIDRRDRLPARPVISERGSPASGPGDRGAHRACAPDRSERAQLRTCRPHGARRARPGRPRPVSRRHQELRSRTDLPHDHRATNSTVRSRPTSPAIARPPNASSWNFRRRACARAAVSKAVPPLQDAAAVRLPPRSTPAACRTPAPRPSERPAAGAPEVMPDRQLRAVLSLGTTQTLAWASSYYLPAILADPIARDLGISSNWFFAAFSGSLVISGLLGPPRRAADRPRRRPAAPVGIQHHPCGRACSPRGIDIGVDDDGSMAAPRCRDGARPVRRCIRRTGPHLRRQRPAARSQASP